MGFGVASFPLVYIPAQTGRTLTPIQDTCPLKRRCSIKIKRLCTAKYHLCTQQKGVLVVHPCIIVVPRDLQEIGTPLKVGRLV